MPAAVDVRDSDSDVAEIVGVVELVDSVQTGITRFFFNVLISKIPKDS